jgi:hypothetical protein
MPHWLACFCLTLKSHQHLAHFLFSLLLLKMDSSQQRRGEDSVSDIARRPSRSMNELRELIKQKEQESHEKTHHVNRFNSTQYNALRAATRDIDPASLKTGRIGVNGIHR